MTPQGAFHTVADIALDAALDSDRKLDLLQALNRMACELRLDSEAMQLKLTIDALRSADAAQLRFRELLKGVAQ